MSETREATREELLQELKKKDLKIQALLQDITSTRDNNADLRVDITQVTEYAQQLQAQVQQQQEQANVQEEKPEPTD